MLLSADNGVVGHDCFGVLFGGEVNKACDLY